MSNSDWIHFIQQIVFEGVKNMKLGEEINKHTGT